MANIAAMIADSPSRHAHPVAHSVAVEDYVKCIWTLEELGEEPTGSAIAARMDVSPASVTGMGRKLVQLGLVEQEPYRPWRLTASGRMLALEVVRHHRLLELFLTSSLGMDWDRVHAEAEVLEHHISEELEELIAKALGDPQFDPHGHPIPKRDGTMPEHVAGRPLAELAPGASGAIRQVRDETPEVLRFLSERGMFIGARVTVREQVPLVGTTTILINPDGPETTVGRELAAHIDIEVDA
ncbi:MAG: metal-dependent transcriptional regulator [Gaiellales bacterium]